ncbi:extracellular solute-binding protein [Frankia sp. Cas3]|uniref:extracellular solute-binding protein n=1 Tax=Frankia sp. Cas3 TaxID=3073926 RepID=UPI002AD233D9|nr:extracellular solute-binding protein [Frankia sp. Cas3]
MQGRQPRRATSRRSFLRGSIGAAAATGLSALVAACSDSSTGKVTDQRLPKPSPGNPVLWPISGDNRPIAGSLQPERDRTLKIFNWPDYIDPQALKSFRDSTGVTVDVTTFSDNRVALEAIAAGTVDYDIYLPSYDQLPRLVGNGHLRPLNHSYIPNISQVWPDFSNPFYDLQWRYTVPYTVYNTGIAWRSDIITEDISARDNPFDVFWDGRYRDKISVINDYRAVMGMVLLRNGLDLNTDRNDDLDLVRTQLADMIRATRPKATITNYRDLPGGHFPIVQAWSGDVINARNYLAKDADPNILRYWSPTDARHQADNDLMVILRAGKSPVAAHMFLNHMLDFGVVLGNFAAIGYQPPQNRITSAGLVGQGFLPASLASAVVEPTYFATGQRILELDPDTDRRWRSIWDEFRTST